MHVDDDRKEPIKIDPEIYSRIMNFYTHHRKMLSHEISLKDLFYGKETGYAIYLMNDLCIKDLPLISKDESIRICELCTQAQKIFLKNKSGSNHEFELYEILIDLIKILDKVVPYGDQDQHTDAVSNSQIKDDFISIEFDLLQKEKDLHRILMDIYKISDCLIEIKDIISCPSFQKSPVLPDTFIPSNTNKYVLNHFVDRVECVLKDIENNCIKINTDIEELKSNIKESLETLKNFLENVINNKNQKERNKESSYNIESTDDLINILRKNFKDIMYHSILDAFDKVGGRTNLNG